nr:MAG TPA: hypothetical protein [Inoviridae sp.]
MLLRRSASSFSAYAVGYLVLKLAEFYYSDASIIPNRKKQLLKLLFSI